MIEHDCNIDSGLLDRIQFTTCFIDRIEKRYEQVIQEGFDPTHILIPVEFPDDWDEPLENDRCLNLDECKKQINLWKKCNDGDSEQIIGREPILIKENQESKTRGFDDGMQSDNLFCFKCGAETTKDEKIKRNKSGGLYGYCNSCKRKTSFVDYKPTYKNIVAKERESEELELEKIKKKMGIKKQDVIRKNGRVGCMAVTKKQLDKLREEQEAKKTDEDKEIEHIMNEKQCDFEIAVRLYNDRKERKKVQEIRKKQTELNDSLPNRSPREIIEEELKKLEDFSENPLANIFSVIIKKHIGTEKELKSALTGLLYILRTVSKKDASGLLKVIGSSSAGKTNLVKTLLSCFPDGWVKEVGELSENAIKYMIWKDEKILYIKEASGAEKSTESLKLMDAGDGGFTACVTRGSPAEGFYTEEIQIPVKFIITTRAEGIFDPQLENRMFALSIDESLEQTFNVLLHRCKDFAGHVKDADFGIVKKFISELKPFDEIKVPFSYEFLNILEQKKIRVRRDIDKILSLCQTSAFINQKNRPFLEENNKNILFCTPEDAYNVFVLSFPSFQETITGLSDRLQRVYDAIDPDASTYRDIAKKLGSYKMKVIREIESLDNMGLVEINTSSNTHTVKRLEQFEQMKKDFENYKLNLLAYSGLEISYYLKDCMIPIEWYDINDTVKCNTKRNKLLQNNNPYQENHNNNRNKSVTKKQLFYEKEEILEYFGDNKEVIISHFCYGFVTLFVTLSSPYNFVSFKYCNIVTNQNSKADIDLEVTIPSCYDVTPKPIDQAGDVKKLYEFVQKNIWVDDQTGENVFQWDDKLKDFIQNELGKTDPDAWINKNIELGVLKEHTLGNLRFLHDFGGDSL
jgi:hypothetical protein